MKEKKRVVAYKYLPTKFPISLTALAWLILDRLHADGFAQGITWTLVAICWIAAIVGTIQEQDSEPEWKR